MKEIKYTSPQESFTPENGYAHTLELEIEGKKIGYAKLKYMSKPFPFYYFSYLKVDEKYRGEGYASEILLKTNEFIKSRGKPAILLINEENIRGMCERSGWKKIESDPDFYVYNLPANFDSKLLDKAIQVIDHRIYNV